MIIILKNKVSLIFDDFCFKCCIGKKGLGNKKIEGDKKTPIGQFSLGNLHYRRDRIKKPVTRLKSIPINKPLPLTSLIKLGNVFFIIFNLYKKYFPTIYAFFCKFSFSIISNTVLPTVQETGLPPNELKYSIPLLNLLAIFL